MEKQQEKPKKTRERSRVLDAATVKAFAHREGLDTLERFDLAVQKSWGSTKEQSNSVAVNAWTGKPIDKNRAIKLADFFGLAGDFTKLQAPAMPKWLSLLQQASHGQAEGEEGERFFRLISQKNPGKLIDLGLNPEDHLDQIKVSSKWLLEISGQAGDKVFILLRSFSRLILVAPLNLDQGFDNTFIHHILFYPTNEIGFERSAGLGWREFIVIKAQVLPFQPRHPDQGLSVGIDELERFANQVLEHNDTVKVGRYPFVLVP